MKIKSIFIAMVFFFLAFWAFNQTSDCLNAKLDPGWQITPQQYGAKGNGTADDTAAIRAADAAAKGGAGVTYLPGTYRINSNVTFNAPVIMVPGATFAHGGNSLTFNGLFDAGDFRYLRRWPCFVGTKPICRKGNLVSACLPTTLM